MSLNLSQKIGLSQNKQTKNPLMEDDCYTFF